MPGPLLPPTMTAKWQFHGRFEVFVNSGSQRLSASA
jgi:hypothetical protein